MARTTQQQLRFLHEIEQLDRLHLGCLRISAKFDQARAQRVETQCVARGWIRTEPSRRSSVRVMYLTTRGLRLLARSSRRFQPHLPLGVGE